MKFRVARQSLAVIAAALAFCATAPASELPVETPPYIFTGPVPARNFQPIQLIFLQLPFERAATVGAGKLAIDLRSTESNVISTTDSLTTSRLKFETNRTVIGLRYGLSDRWEIGIDLPFITRYGGFLDGFIDFVEDAVGQTNGARRLYPKDRFGAFFVRRSGAVLFDAGPETFQPGDLWLSTKLDLQLPPAWPRTSLRAAVKVPSGDSGSVLGSGKPDLAIGLAAEYQLASRLRLYLNLGLTYPFGPITRANLTLDPMFTQSLAAELALTRRWSGIFHQAFYTSPMHGTKTALLDADVSELGLGINFAFRPWLALQLLAINNVSEVEQAADFSVVLAARIRP